ncbi:MAG: diguanylate cyclase [Lachnospiraceae bacterium]|nr:diguanylate cyclase [Lachnospiraceae bacterium]
MKRLRENDIRQYIQAIFFFMLLVFCLLLLFFFFVQKDVESNVQAIISNNVDQQSHHFQSILEAQYDYLDGVADYIGKSEELLSEDNMELIHFICENSELERMCIVDEEGIAHYDSGEEKSVAFRRYFKEGISGQRTLSDPLESRLDGATRVVLGVPVFHGEKVVGVLGGSYDVTSLSRMLFEDIYQGQGFSLILMQDGSVISCDDEDRLPEDDSDRNFFTYYQDNVKNQQALEKMRSDFSEGNNGYIQIYSNDKKYYAAYVPLEYNSWVVCYMVSTDAAKQSYQFIMDYEIYLMAGFIALVLVLFWNILHISRKKQKELIKFASMDALTGLSNKKSTEDSIQEWLNASGEQHQGVQAFLIMDIDYFKGINDRYGHSAGDEALRRLGECLRDTFRKDDIVGRIGGDEFVVFMRNMSSGSDVERKAEKLLMKVRQMKIQGLENQGITISMGIAFAPDHGDGYLALYKHADMALYETKERGRNGYTVYSGTGH